MRFEISKILGVDIISITPLSGGCIGENYRVEIPGKSLFIKKYKVETMAQKEANSLRELSKVKSINTPLVVKFTSNLLVLEYIEEGNAKRTNQKNIAKDLVSIHSKRSNKFGFYEDNFIGLTPQCNKYCTNWSDFFIDNRLCYQIDLLKRKNYTEIYDLFSILKPKIKHILAGSEEEPTLIHGDLWAGNVIINNVGEPVFIDPSVCYGHRELDLAMTNLFGGFKEEFYEEYNRLMPLKKGWQDRENLYKLYHILNHLNIFGNSYLNQAKSLIMYYL